MLLEEFFNLFREPLRMLDHRRVTAIFDGNELGVWDQFVEHLSDLHGRDLIVLSPKEESWDLYRPQEIFKVVLWKDKLCV
jgi:hypothetical protein